MGYKTIKDPLHGYIEVNEDWMKNIIDSAEFQRLREVRQTSYVGLYPGSTHNRFIHSLGVYFLGGKVFESFKNNVIKSFPESEEKGSLSECWESLKNTFLLACLLHDVGHAPFSHTGEEFFAVNTVQNVYKLNDGKNINNVAEIYSSLVKVLSEKCSITDVWNWQFRADFTNILSVESNIPANHEIMSVIIALKSFHSFCETQQYIPELFTRMIIGCKYKHNTNLNFGVKNALITLLHSSIMDVDRLDYLMRDVMMTGFKTTAIDAHRLLESACLNKDRIAQTYSLGFKKQALSVIENVLLAHDSEKRWIQNHPFIIYEMELIKDGIRLVNKVFNISPSTTSIFVESSLGEGGLILKNNTMLRYMSDADIIFLLKQEGAIDSSKEFFDRKSRKKALWKSESEFEILLTEMTTDDRKKLFSIFIPVSDASSTAENVLTGRIDEKKLLALKDKLQENKRIKPTNNEKEDVDNVIVRLERLIFWAEKLKNFAEENKEKFEYHAATVKKFKSGLAKLKEEELQIRFDKYGVSRPIDKALTLYEHNGKSSDGALMFYLFLFQEKPGMPAKFKTFLKEAMEEYKGKFFKV